MNQPGAIARARAALLRHAWPYVLMAGVLFILAIFLLYPIWLTVRGGFATDITSGTGFTLDHVLSVFRDPRLLDGLFNSAKVALTTTTLTILISLP
ncbi:MAG: hypothetical protein JNL50_05990, partial [Phycisphaerae bacterium]|nr:hypothetical protein [Phycisphaerae bacterium]